MQGENETDVILEKIGFGRWQVIQFCWLQGIYLIWANLLLGVVLIGFVPDFACNGSLNDATYANDSTYTIFDNTCEWFNSTSNQSEACQNGYIYFEPQHVSFLSEWDLVCGKEFLSDLSQTLINVGLFLGCLVFTPIADKFGRRLVTLWAHVGVLVVSTATSFVPNIWLFLAARIFTGCFISGAGVVNWILTLELFTPKQRSMAAVIGQIIWGFSVCTLPGLGYLMDGQSWRHLHLLFTAFAFVCVGQFITVEESIRWLLANGQRKKAMVIVSRVCKTNGVDSKVTDEIINDHFLNPYKSPEEQRHEMLAHVNNKSPEERHEMLAHANNKSPEERHEMLAHANNKSPEERHEMLAHVNNKSPEERHEMLAHANNKSPEERHEMLAHVNNKSPEERHEMLAHANNKSPEERHEMLAHVNNKSPKERHEMLAHANNKSPEEQCHEMLPHVNYKSSEEQRHEMLPHVNYKSPEEQRHEVLPHVNYKSPEEQRHEVLPHVNYKSSEEQRHEVLPHVNYKSSEGNEQCNKILPQVNYEEPGGFIMEGETPNSSSNVTLMDILRHPTLRKITLFSIFAWFTNSLTYSGLYLLSSEMSGSRYLNLFLNAVVEIPSAMILWPLTKKSGRRWMTVVFHVLAGICMITAAVLHTTTAGHVASIFQTAVLILGKFAITSSFMTIYMYTPELYPTNIRSIGLAIGSIASRFGGFVSPFSASIARSVPWAPVCIFGVLCILVAVCSLTIPETKNKQLPQTLVDLSRLSEKRKR